MLSNTMAVAIPDDNRESIPVGMYSWDFATSINFGELCHADQTDQTAPPFIPLLISGC
jgi:hypothetical protein